MTAEQRLKLQIGGISNLTKGTLKISSDGQTRIVLADADVVKCDYCGCELRFGESVNICELDKRIICDKCVHNINFACVFRSERFEHIDYKGTLTRMKA